MQEVVCTDVGGKRVDGKGWVSPRTSNYCADALGASLCENTRRTDEQSSRCS